MSEDVCHGCKIPKMYENECIVRKCKKSKLCPCTQCIVKMICEVSCQQYERFCRENNVWK